MNVYEVRVLCNGIDMYESRDDHRKIFYDCGIKNVKWLYDHSTPANWLGYNEDNPGPGHTIKYIAWQIVCDKETLLKLKLQIDMLKCKAM